MIGYMKRGSLGSPRAYGNYSYGAFWDFLRKPENRKGKTGPSSPEDIAFAANETPQGFRDVSGAGGYVYRQYANGSIQILAGPSGVGATLTSGTAWTEITREIGPYPQSGLVSTLTGLFGGGQQAAAPAPTPQMGAGGIPAQSGGILALFAPLLGQGVTAVTQTIQAKRQSMAGLQAQLARKQQAFLNAAGNPVRQARLKAQIQSLHAQIAALESEIAGGNQAVVSTVPVPTQPSKMGWLPFALGGGALLLLLGGAAFAFTRKKRGR